MQHTAHYTQQFVIPPRTPKHNAAHSSCVPLTHACISLLELLRLRNSNLRVALRLCEFHISALDSSNWLGKLRLGAIVVQCNIWRLAQRVLQVEMWTLEIDFMVTPVNFIRRLPSFIIEFIFMWQCVAAADVLANRLACIVCPRSLETMCCYLSLWSPVVTLCTAKLNIKKYVLPTQLYLCVLCGSQNKQRLFPYTTLTDWFV